MKDELLHQLAENRAVLWQAIADLPEEQIVSAPVIDAWTIKDAVGHIAYWEGVILDHVRESYTEGRPRPARDDENDDMINAREAAKRKDRPWSRVRAEYENVRAALIGYVDRLSETDLAFQVPSPWRNEQRFYSVGQMIEEDAIGHCREHTEQIERWKRGNTSTRLSSSAAS
jgi:uncharacterized damage-inducible protein DinB